MKLSRQVLSWALLPFLAAVGLILFQVYQLQDSIDVTIQKRLQQSQFAINQKIHEEIHEIDATATLLASAIEIIEAIDVNDADVPYQWGKQFMAFNMDRIYFIDKSGIVLARGHDEYQFGDDVSRKPYVADALKQQKIIGILPGIDTGSPTMVVMLPVMKFDEFMTGLIIVEKEINSALLQRIVDRKEGFLTFSHGDGTIATSLEKGMDKNVLDEFAFELNRGDMQDHYGVHIVLHEDNRLEKKSFQALFNQILLISLIVFPIAVLAIIYFVRNLLKPLESMGKELDSYANHRISLSELRERVEAISTRKNELGEINESISETLQALEETQEQLIESEKMSSLGGLVAGVAHELNTPLGICVTGLSSLDERFREITSKIEGGSIKKSELTSFLQNGKEYCQLLEHNIKRASSLVQSFKEVSVDQATEEKREFDLKIYLDEIILSLKPQLKKTAHQIEVSCPEHVLLHSYPGALSQIITNFVFNSLLHAFENTPRGLMKIDVTNEGKQQIQIVYSDDGCGMNEEVQERIFDPFFTTKRGHGGTGLGMHIVYNLIVQKLHGQVHCHSAPGRGTQFVITIPKQI